MTDKNELPYESIPYKDLGEQKDADMCIQLAQLLFHFIEKQPATY